jgi:hypothetical protein
MRKRYQEAFLPTCERITERLAGSEDMKRSKKRYLRTAAARLQSLYLVANTG